MPRDTSDNRAVLYCRVSTDDQADNGTSLDEQERRGLAYAADHHWVVPDGWAFSEDLSGYKKHRPELDKLRALVRREHPVAVIFFDISRLARKWRLQTRLMSEFEDDEGVECHFTEHKRPETMEDWLLLDVEGFAVEKQRNYIVKATNEGLLERVMNGGMRVGRFPNYGYLYQDLPPAHTWERGKPKWTYVLDERAEAVAVMRDIYRWLLQGWTECRIAEELNRQAVRTPEQYHWDMGHRAKRAVMRPTAKWSRGTIYSLVRNTVYMGEKRSHEHVCSTVMSDERDRHLGERREKRVVRRATERWDPASGKEPRPGQYIVHRVPAIVDEETWAAAQRVLADNREHNNPRNSTAPDIGMLKGLVYCSACGYRMHRVNTKRRGGVTWTYRCTRRESSHGAGCPAGNMQASLPRLDTAVWEH
jgi:site-specific DNA recombinase